MAERSITHFNHLIAAAILLLIFFTNFHLWSQNSNDTSRTNKCISLTTYPFAYDTKMHNGSIASGPSFLLCGKRLCMQIGLLYDFKKYIYYEHITHFQIDSARGFNLFFPLLFHYSYYIHKRINCFITAGAILGGRYYIDENNYTRQARGLNLIAGTGISFNIFRNFHMRVMPSLRYKGVFFPGALVDFSFQLNKK
jgi:hypothetical protein